MVKSLLRRHRMWRSLRDWIVLAWALWWSWAYVQGALAARFPRILWWTIRN